VTALLAVFCSLSVSIANWKLGPGDPGVELHLLGLRIIGLRSIAGCHHFSTVSHQAASARRNRNSETHVRSQSCVG
jgi:hypothetical protein